MRKKQMKRLEGGDQAFEGSLSLPTAAATEAITAGGILAARGED